MIISAGSLVEMGITEKTLMYQMDIYFDCLGAEESIILKKE